MFALIDFFARLVGDVGRFLDVFLNDIVLGAGDPLSALLILVGMLSSVLSIVRHSLNTHVGSAALIDRN